MNTQLIENTSRVEAQGDFEAEAREQLALLTKAYQRLRLSADAARLAAWADLINFPTTASSSRQPNTLSPCNP